MLQIQHVLHPTDFSEGARAAFQHALHLARHHGAAVHVLHVARFEAEVAAPPYLGTFYDPEGRRAQLQAEIQADIANVRLRRRRPRRARRDRPARF